MLSWFAPETNQSIFNRRTRQCGANTLSGSGFCNSDTRARSTFEMVPRRALLLEKETALWLLPLTPARPGIEGWPYINGNNQDQIPKPTYFLGGFKKRLSIRFLWITSGITITEKHCWDFFLRSPWCPESWKFRATSYVSIALGTTDGWFWKITECPQQIPLTNIDKLMNPNNKIPKDLILQQPSVLDCGALR